MARGRACIICYTSPMLLNIPVLRSKLDSVNKTGIFQGMSVGAFAPTNEHELHHNDLVETIWLYKSINCPEFK